MSIDYSSNCPIRVGSKVWFAKAGTNIPSFETPQVVDASHMPTEVEADNPCFLSLGNVLKVDSDYQGTKETAWKINDAGLVVPAAEDTVKVERSWLINLQSVTKLSVEVAFNCTLDENGEGVIDSALDIKGWLFWTSYRNGATVFAGNIWSSISLDGSLSFDAQKFLDYNIRVTQLDNAANKIKYIPPTA